MHCSVRSITATVLLVTATGTAFGQPQATRLWETKTDLKAPESVVYDSARAVLYVSNINGSPEARDGNGFVAQVSLEGEIRNLQWVTGLNGPKGMAVAGDRLYVADITELVEIDIVKGAVTQRYPGPDARFLNDVTVDRNGAVFVSDSDAKNSAVYRLSGGAFAVWLRGADLTRPNGVVAGDNRLVVGMAQGGGIYGIALNRTLKKIGRASFGIDGIVPDGRTGFFVSDFAGRVAHITSEFGEMPLLDLTAEGRNAADIEYIPGKKMLLVPTFAGNTVAAYLVQSDE